MPKFLLWEQDYGKGISRIVSHRRLQPKLVMLTPEQEKYIFSHAYIPEHIVGLITTVSGAEPFLVEDYFCCYKDDWLIVIGYPLDNNFVMGAFTRVLDKVKREFKPAHLSLIAPQLPESIEKDCQERESDQYYTLVVREPSYKNSTKRNLMKAGELLRVECASKMGKAQQDLMQEFIRSRGLPARVVALIMKMPEYVASDKSAFVLNAWDADDRLAAFYVVDVGARQFANYTIGCYSRENYVRGASDLLLAELIRFARDHGKSYIHLGLGINPGIRRFKEKWGGIAGLPYEMGELGLKRPSILETFMTIMKKRN